MSSSEYKPNGCDESNWKLCKAKGYLIKGVYCKHPKNTYDKEHIKIPICPFNKNAVEISK